VTAADYALSRNDRQKRRREPELTPESSGPVRVAWKMRDHIETPLYLLEGGGFYEDRNTAGVGYDLLRHSR